MSLRPIAGCLHLSSIVCVFTTYRTGVYIYLVSYVSLRPIAGCLHLSSIVFTIVGSDACLYVLLLFRQYGDTTHSSSTPSNSGTDGFFYISLFMTNVGLFKTQGLVRVYTGKNIYIPFSHIAATFILLKITNWMIGNITSGSCLEMHTAILSVITLLHTYIMSVWNASNKMYCLTLH